MIPSYRKMFNLFGRELLCRGNRNKAFGRTYQKMVKVRQKPNCLIEIIGKEKWSRKTELNNYRTISTMLEIHREADLSNIKSLGVTLEEAHQFLELFTELEPEIIGPQLYKDLPEVTRRLERVSRVTVPDIKRTPGLVLLAVYKRLEQSKRLSKDGIRMAMILGWCGELVEGLLNIMDDIMDAGDMRRGNQCWYKHEGVGLSAINDAVLLEQGIYSLLRAYFSQHPCYVPAMEILHRIILKTSIGQLMDLSSKHGRPNLDVFTMDRYKLITSYKSGYISYLPIALGMYLSKIFDEKQHRQVEALLLLFGHSLQIRNDFVDCFGDPSKIEKGNGTDIQEGKCTWLIVMALQRASEMQRRLLEEHYGRKEEESVAMVRTLYEELDLPNIFATYLEEDEKCLLKQVQNLCDGLPHDLFKNIFDYWLEGQGYVRSCNIGAVEIRIKN